MIAGNVQLEGLLHSLNKRCGQKRIYQLHKETISYQSWTSFMKMAKKYDICCVLPNSNLTNKNEVVDVYDAGFKAMQADIKKNSAKMDRMRPATTLHEDTIDDTEEIHDEEQVYDNEDEED
jgi:hypothetical protein